MPNYIGARIVRHGRYVVFQLAEVPVSCALFAGIHEDRADERRKAGRRGVSMTDLGPVVREIRNGSSANSRPWV